MVLSCSLIITRDLAVEVLAYVTDEGVAIQILANRLVILALVDG